MTVAVNQPREQESDLDKLYKAIGVATNVYGVYLDKQRQNKLDEIAGKKLTQEQMDREQAQLDKQKKEQLETQNREVDLDRDFGLVNPGTQGGIKLPGRDGLFLPRNEIARRDNVALDKQKAAATANEKKLASGKQHSEVSYRYNNLQKNAQNLQNIVEKEGTMALTGTAGTDMDSAIYQMAVDYAKLVDPDSVAREGEVAAAQKYMLPIRDFGGATTSNATAVQNIKNYMKSLDDRLSSRIEALESSGQDASSLKEVLVTNQKGREQEAPGFGTAIAAPAPNRKAIKEMSIEELKKELGE